MDTDVYYHKTLTFRAWRHELRFRTSQQLFSSHDIDVGTRFLLRTIVEAGYSSPESVLDIGCGYGPLGLTLKSLYPDSAVHLADRDALAAEYAGQNAALNGLNGVEIYGSLGYDDVTRNDFNLIVSNIPGKAGEPVIAYLLQEARYYLAPGGIAAIVIVSPLEETAAKILANTPGTEIILRRARSGHTVFHYRFAGKPEKPGLSAFERGVYHRKDMTIRLDPLEYAMQTAYGLPEFDSLSYDTGMLIKILMGAKYPEIDRALVFNPGQGHVPAALWKILHPREIYLADRDLLALRNSRLNLISNGCPAEAVNIFHTAGLNGGNGSNINLITGVLPEDENKEATYLLLDKAADLLSPKGLMVISGRSTPITRLVAYIESGNVFKIIRRERRRGYSVLAVERVAPS